MKFNTNRLGALVCTRSKLLLLREELLGLLESLGSAVVASGAGLVLSTGWVNEDL